MASRDHRGKEFRVSYFEYGGAAAGVGGRRFVDDREALAVGACLSAVAGCVEIVSRGTHAKGRSDDGPGSCESAKFPGK